jgi:hypothetical protein
MITGGIDAVDRHPEEFSWSESLDAPTALGKEHRGAPRDVDGDPPFSQSPLKSLRYVSRYLKSSAGWRDVAMVAVSSA